LEPSFLDQSGSYSDSFPTEMTILREELLAGRAIALAGGAAETTADTLAALGARIERFDPLEDEEAAAQWAREHAPLDALVYDAGGAFGAGEGDGLRAAIDTSWAAVRALATGALVEQERPGKVVLVAPRADAGRFAPAARAALENLARTLSIEWARYGITAVAIAPGPATSEDELAQLVAFLVSPAGEYYSGCRFELGSVIRAS
jgi:NAD(P)-dependent dehydrogenase (short-subunit alcohol dehydrogenase family)